jgi:hypothetical protein
MTISICPFYRKDTVDEAFCPFSYLEVHKETLVLETHYDENAKSVVAMCSSCKGFYSAINISSHRTNCHSL